MVSYKLSLHSHTSNFAHFLAFSPNKKEYLEELIRKLTKKHGNIVLGVSNFNDDRYGLLLKATSLLSKEYKVNTDHKECFFSVKYQNKSIHFVKSDEINTEKGHILIVGYTKSIHNHNLHDILKAAHKQHCIIIANHPLHTPSTSYFFVKKIFGLHSDISLTSEDIKKHKKDFDAVELNSYFPEDWHKIREFSKKTGIPTVSDSDSHFLNEMFTSWYEIKDLSFSSPNKFKKSLKKGLRKGLHIHAAKYGFLAVYKHVLQVMIEHFGRKLGIYVN
ncbi:MAG TPA: PHP-associated domain-containing protein [Candidatus Nanoarchaeia archaeon]|nr:PHP-associated domain-containing protein [Candidatus Nanoarchaeia archaeon]